MSILDRLLNFDIHVLFLFCTLFLGLRSSWRMLLPLKTKLHLSS